MIQEQKKNFVNTRNADNIETLLHSAGGHHGSSKAHQAGNQSYFLTTCIYMDSWNHE